MGKTARSGDIVIVQDVISQQYVAVDATSNELIMVPASTQAQEFRLVSNEVCFGRSIRETCGFQLTHRDDGDFHIVLIDSLGPTFDLAFQRQTMALPELATSGCKDYKLHYGDAYEISANGSFLQNIGGFVVADNQTLSGQVTKFKFELISQADKSDHCGLTCKTKCGNKKHKSRHASSYHSDSDSEHCSDSDHGYGKKKKKKKGKHRTANTSTVIWILAGVIFFIMLLGLLIWWMFSRSSSYSSQHDGRRADTTHTTKMRTPHYHVLHLQSAAASPKTQQEQEQPSPPPPPPPPPFFDGDDDDMPPQTAKRTPNPQARGDV